MADKKLTELQTLITPSGDDLLYVVTNVNTTPASKQISIGSLFSSLNVPVTLIGNFTQTGNFNISGSFTLDGTITSTSISTTNLTVLGDGVIISNKLTPSSSDVAGIPAGKIFYDDNYLYIRINETTIKRIDLQTF